MSCFHYYLKKLAKVKTAHVGIDVEKPKSSLAAVAQNVQIFLPLAGLIDVEAEKQRLSKQIAKLEQELSVIQRKLGNEQFVSNAKEEVVAKEKEKEAEVSDKLSKTKDIYNGL